MFRTRRLAVVAPLALTATCLLPTVPADAATVVTCHGLRATIVGSDGPNTVNGTDGPDVISGLGGDDRILGLGGDDVICGGKGRDDLQGGDGDDHVYGARGGDRLSGGDGDDLVSGGNGRGNTYTADAGNDTWVSGEIRDFHWPGGFTYFTFKHERFEYSASTSAVQVDLPGGTADGDAIGHDTLQIHDLAEGLQVVGSPFDDDIITGPGRDAVLDVGGGGTIDTGGGWDVVSHYGSTAHPSPITILGDTGADHIELVSDDQSDVDGGPGADEIFTWSNGSVTGGDGDDAIWGSTNARVRPTLSGGAGTDEAHVGFGASLDLGTVDVDLDAAVATSSLRGELFALTAFENVEVEDQGSEPGTSFVLRGTDGDNDLTVRQVSVDAATPSTLYGLGGDDRLLGGSGDDTLDGGAGHDLGQGGPGDDTCLSIEGPLGSTGTCEVSESRQ